jgi:lipopolysaccharide biosynthesis protein
MSSRGLDFWGNTDSYERSYHVQTYFLVLERPALGFFREWVRRMKLIEDREAIIMRYEVGLGREASKAGLHFGALVSSDTLLAHADRFGMISDKLAARLRVRPGYFNPTHEFWREAISPFGSAYIKRDLLRHLRTQGDAYVQARTWLSETTHYPVSLIDAYFEDT